MKTVQETLDTVSLVLIAVCYTGLILAYFTFFMVPKNLVMYFSVVKKEKQKFLKKVENSECTAHLKVKNQKSRIFSFKKNI